MGQIFVEGIGVIDIAGDAPSPDESRAITDALLKQAAPAQRPIVREGCVVPEGATPKPQAERKHMVWEETRGGVRKFVEEQQGLAKFAMESAPGVVGSAVGGAVGAPAGPPGVILGATVGGLLGEFLAQETGVAPESEVNLAVAAGGAAAGTATGSLLQLGRKAVGAGISKLPAVQSAQARIAERKSVEEFES